MKFFRFALMWTFFVSPLAVAASLPMTLSEARARVLVVAPTLAAARAKIRALRAEAHYKTTLPDPILGFGPQNLDSTQPTLSHDNSSSFVVSLNQNFPPFGKLHLARKGLDENVQSARMRLQDERARLIATLTVDFCDYYYGKQALITLRRNRHLAHVIARSALFRYQSGHGTLAGLLQARYAVSGIDDAIARLRGALAVRRATLMQLLSVRHFETATSKPDIPHPPPFVLLLKGLTLTPRFAADEARVRAARAFLRASRRDLAPSFAIGASYGFRTAPSYPGGPKAPNQISAEISMSLPIFPGQREDQRIDRRVARLDGARDQAAALQLSLRQAALAARAALQTADRRLRILSDRRLPEARTAFRAAQAAFASGRMSLVRTLRYARDVRSTQLAAWQLRSERAKALATLNYLGTHAETSYAR